MKQKIATILELAKVKITIAVSFTMITGYVLFHKGFSWKIILPTLGIFLLACGSSVINQIQEYKTDDKMERTKNRPLPSGKINLKGAWITAIIFVLTGSLILWFTSSIIGFMLGLIALLWYNLIYTYLKRWTYFAVIPGSVIGAIPPLVGWTTAGGPLLDERTMAIAFFFFVWQVPHFWLLMLKYGKQYQKAGFPTITVKPGGIVRLMTFIWTVTTAISAVFLSYFKVVDSKISIMGVILASSWLLYEFIKLFAGKSNMFSPGKYFMKINYYVLAVILFLLTDHLFYRYLV